MQPVGNAGSAGSARPIGSPRSTRHSPGNGARHLAGCSPAFRGEIDDEQVDGPALHEGAGHREALVERRGREDDEPFESNAAGHGLHRIEASGEIEPGNDGPTHLGLGGEPQSERRLPARVIASQCEGRITRDSAGTEDRVERRKAGRNDATIIRPNRSPVAREGLLERARLRPEWRTERIECGRDTRICLGFLERSGGQGERAGYLTTPSRSCLTPAFPKGRQDGRHAWRRSRHGPQMIEHLFYQSRPWPILRHGR